MNVRIRFFSSLREAANLEELALTIEDGTTISMLLEEILRKCGSNLRNALLDRDGRLKSYISVLLNGRSISFLQGLDTIVHDGDVVDMLPPTSGG